MKYFLALLILLALWYYFVKKKVLPSNKIKILDVTWDWAAPVVHFEVNGTQFLYRKGDPQLNKEVDGLNVWANTQNISGGVHIVITLDDPDGVKDSKDINLTTKKIS